MAARPVCVHCQQPYGQRNINVEIVRWAKGDQEPPYIGNGKVVKKSVFHGANDSHTVINGIDVTGYHFRYRHIWDGESWIGGYNPFCTLRCALDYARKAHQVLKLHQRRQEHA